MRLATIHQTLAEVRKERGISQSDLAVALNVEQAAISMYENGKRGIPLALLDDWFAVLDIEISIIPKGHEPLQAPDIVQRELEEFKELKHRRNYLVAEMRSMMACRVMSDAVFQESDEESGESRFWAYSFHDENGIGLVESRTDHPHAKHLAVEYTDEEVNVYRLVSGSLDKAFGSDRAYMTEDDFLRHGAVLDFEEMAAVKSTIFRTNAGRPDGVELVSPEGFPVRSLLDMQETLKRFSSVYDEVIGRADHQEMEDELLRIEGRLDELLIDNRLENGMLNPEFARWTEDDEQAVSVPLHSAERIWQWVEEGVSWVDDCHEEVSLRLWVDPDVHEAYETLLDEDGGRVIGAIGPEKSPAVFKVNPAKPEVIHRVEVRLEDLTDQESERYDRILESARELDDPRNEEE